MKTFKKFFTILIAVLMCCVCFAAACDDPDDNGGGGGGGGGGGETSKTVSSIDITTEPTKKESTVGDELELDGGELTVYYTDGSSGSVSMTAEGVTASADMNTPGANVTVTVTYQSKTDTYRISVVRPTVYYTVTFNYNYEGAPQAYQVEVESGKTATPPAEPEREDFRFAGWFTAAEGGESYAFGPVTADTTVYAQWADANAVTLTMKWNMAGQPENFQIQPYEKGDTLPRSLPEPTLEGYRFMGWYFDEGLTEEYKRGPIEEDMVVYAKWFTEYIFEAEQTDISSIEGVGYSNGRGGEDLVFASDDGTGPDMKASGGYYIAGLYVQGNELVFVINSDKAVSDATLVLRLAAEFRNITMSPDPAAPDYYTISVNGTAIDYDEITLQGTDATVIDGGQYPFEDYTVTASLSLRQGENVIRLTTSNANAYTVGTQKANAPMVDCIKIYTTAVLTWTPVDNIPD